MNPDRLYLVQTDTTAGFLSRSARRLAGAKERPAEQPLLRAIASLRQLSALGRVPVAARFRVRRAGATSFILPGGRSFRRIADPRHSRFIERFGWLYTTSANRHGALFGEAVARQRCDVIVETAEGFASRAPSPIFRLGKKRMRKVRGKGVRR